MIFDERAHTLPGQNTIQCARTTVVPFTRRQLEWLITVLSLILHPSSTPFFLCLLYSTSVVM